MSGVLWNGLGGLVLIGAAVFLVRRMIRFFRTGGRSACENCPYSGNCPGKCKSK